MKQKELAFLICLGQNLHGFVFVLFCFLLRTTLSSPDHGITWEPSERIDKGGT